MNENKLHSLIEPLLAQHGMELDRLEVVNAGRRSLLRITVDGDGPDGHGPGLDEIGEATTAISDALDDSEAVGRSSYTLEVSSRGVSTPLTEPKHFRRNVGRLVQVSLAEGDQPPEQLTGRIVASDDDSVSLEVEAPGSRPHKRLATTREIPLDRIRRAVVQVEMNRKTAATDEEN